MSFIIEQTELLSKLANLLSNSFRGNFTHLESEYKYLEKYNTISTSYNYIDNNKKNYFKAPPGIATDNFYICMELRALMKEHTGGEWTSFTLTLDADGRANTKFNYPES